MDNQLDISIMTTEQLEALAYRLVEQKSNLEINLSTVQQQLAKKRQEGNNQASLPIDETEEPDEIIHED